MDKSLDYIQTGIKGVEIKKCHHAEHTFKEHLHNELSIGYIEEGETDLLVNGVNYYMKAGDAIVIQPHVMHRCIPRDITKWQSTIIYVSKDIMETLNIATKFPLSHHQSAIEMVTLSKQHVEMVLELIEVLTLSRDTFEKETLLGDILLQLSCTADTKVYFDYNALANRSLKYIEDHVDGTLSLREMEEALGASRYTIIKAFREHYNATPGAYSMQLRAAKAKGLIRTSLTLVEVATEAGYYDQAHFSREFKKAYGVTPKAYREMLIT